MSNTAGVLIFIATQLPRDHGGRNVM